MATYWLKIAYLLLGAPAHMFSLEFRGEVNQDETI